MRAVHDHAVLLTAEARRRSAAREDEAVAAAGVAAAVELLKDEPAWPEGRND